MSWVIQTSFHLSDNKKSKRHRAQDLKQWIVIGGWIIGIFVWSGCATTPTEKWIQASGNLPPYHELSAVPFFPQEEYQCGPASLAMVLAWSGLQIDANELAPQVYTPSLKGSLQPAMITAARRHGRVSYLISGADALLKEITAGHPVIVLQNLGLSWIPVWHYAVVIGYDLDKALIILHSGITKRKTTALNTFGNTWARSQHWGLVVLPPNRLPATAEENAYIKAVVGLERAEQWPAAVEGYRTALDRWPQSFSARIGLSKSYYAQGDLESARKVLQKTTSLFPEEGVAFNNLAHVLWRQGKKQEAIKAARRAVMLGGPHAATFQKTLDEIQSDTQ
jgi:hypothetical protein